ncbi:MAG TPA: endonuclease domain-containing protein [Rudaea sp.]
MREGARKQYARQLRASMTDAESHLWKFLRRRPLAGCRFRRQHPVGPYIADFACIERGVLIEIDGGQHNEVVDSDRDTYLRRKGFLVMRFWNNDVLGRTDDVLAAILSTVEKPGPHPGLPPQAGEGE